MSGLDKHFGADASLDPQTAATITTFLEQKRRTQTFAFCLVDTAHQRDPLVRA